MREGSVCGRTEPAPKQRLAFGILIMTLLLLQSGQYLGSAVLLELLFTCISLKVIHDTRFLMPASMLQSRLSVGLLVAIMTYLVHDHAPQEGGSESES